jgi:hypothetical protein
VPELATAGRNQLALYNMVGKFAVAHGKNVVNKWAEQQRTQAKTRVTDQRVTEPAADLSTKAAAKPIERTDAVDVDRAPTKAGASKGTRANSKRAATTRSSATTGTVKQRASVTSVPVTSALPIADYDDLAASQIVGLLGALSAGQRDEIGRYESLHRRRSTVLGKVDRLRAES